MHREERIYVICDQCGRPTPTGLVLDSETVPDPGRAFAENRTNCRLCGHWIVWGHTKVLTETVVLQRFGKLPE